MTEWVALFSGGKDSSLALHTAQQDDNHIERLVTVRPPAESFLYHTPTVDLARLAADSIGVRLTEVEASDASPAGETGSAGHAVAELAPLESALRDLTADSRDAGLVVGAIESAYQHDRIQGMADRLGLEVCAPLWRRDPDAIARDLLEVGFEVMVVKVAAAGLDDSWLGRRLDAAAFDELRRLGEAHGVHLLGEGGEYETLVTDGPHMSRRIELEYGVDWDGVRGEIVVQDAWLA